MALGTITSRNNTTPPNSVERDLIIQVNLLLTAVNAICVKLDADAGVTDVNYTSTLVTGTGLKQIGNAAGTAIST